MFANLFLSDLGLYNEAVKITHEFPQFFPLGVVQHGWTILMAARELLKTIKGGPWYLKEQFLWFLIFNLFSEFHLPNFIRYSSVPFLTELAYWQFSPKFSWRIISLAYGQIKCTHKKIWLNSVFCFINKKLMCCWSYHSSSFSHLSKHKLGI